MPRPPAATGSPPAGSSTPSVRHRLSARWVIHTVGPVWRGGSDGEPELLASCYRRSLEVAEDVGARTIAFPAISTGVYGYPRDEAASIAVGVLRSSTADLDEATLVAFDDETLRLYEALL
jgi:O-acetyl-ADP-ribose deacetylase